jgi:molybdopterin synthase catalytic subunit
VESITVTTLDRSKAIVILRDFLSPPRGRSASLAANGIDMTIRLQREDFDAASEVARMTRARTDIGAVVTFTGICRGEEGGEPIRALTLEHYPGMAEEEIARHVDEAKSRWQILDVTVIHRYGRLEPGDNIVLVATASAHRHDAFAAAEFLMDYLKTRAPFWKQADRTAGKSWVEAKEADSAAADRWTRRSEAAE